MANPVREFFVSKPEAARVVLVDTNGDIYNATGGTGATDVNIDQIGGNPVGSTIPVSGTVSVTEPVSVDDNGGSLTVDGPLTNAELRAVPVPVSGTVAISGTVTVTEPVSVDDNGGSLTVDAVDLDIRNLAFATDKVDVSGSTLAANSGVDIGDVTINNAAGASAVNVQDGGNSLTVDGTVTVGAITAGDNIIGRVKITDGTDLALVTAAGEQNVIATAQPGVDIGDVTINNASGASAVNIQDGGNSITVDQATAANLNAQVVGVAAHDAAVSGNPVLCAGSSETMADSAPANRTTADNEVMRISATDGAVYVIPTGPQTWSFHENSSSALTDTTVHASPGANLSLYVTDIVFSSGAATAINIFFEEGASTVLGPWYLEATAGRGLAIHFGTPKKITAATALTVTTSAAIAHGLDVLGFVAPG